MLEINKKNITIPDTIMVSCAILCRKEGMAEYFRSRCENFALITVTSQLSKSVQPDCKLYHDGNLVASFSLIQLPNFLLRRSKYLVQDILDSIKK